LIKENKMSDVEKSIVKGLDFQGGPIASNAVQVDVKSGKIIRIRSLRFDWRYKPEQFNPWKIEARGSTFEPTMQTLMPPFTLAYKNRIYSPNRVMHPLKRVDWDPNGERNPQNRGTSRYVRISWDEAIDIVASEIKRVQKKYGPTAILAQADGHGESKVIHAAHGCNRKLLSLMGGLTYQSRNPDSWEGWYWGAKHVWGCEPLGKQRSVSNNVPDIAEHSELLLFWGCDPETTPWGWNGQIASRLCYWFTELGIKQVYICPDVNYGNAVHANKWIPIRPNSDAALQLAIACVWITEGTYDKEYIATHAVGFDKFEEYVLGKEDGVPKTPDWAEEKTTIPSRTIKALAREWASKRTTIVHSNGGPMIRGPYSTEPARFEVILLGMQGLGKPGCHQFSMHEWGLFGKPGTFGTGDETNPMPGPMVWPNVSAASGMLLTTQSGPCPIIPKTLIPDAILNPPISWYGTTSCRELVENQFVKYNHPEEGCSEIHMIWTDSPSWMTCWNGSNNMADALRHPKIEFVLAQHPWLENDCLFADIILPSCTKFEVDDIGVDTFSPEFKTIYLDGKCIEPIGESKSEYEIVSAIAEKLGFLEQFTGGESIEQKMRRGFETSGVQDMVTWEEFSEKGYYVIPTDPDWKKKEVGMRGFYEDPENNPLNTPSGKLEFYSQRLAEKFPGDIERPPLPHWIEKGESHDERVSSERAKKYPLLVVSNHPRWRVHSQHDDVKWIREIGTCKVVGPDGYFYEPIWINPADAEKRGIEHGDVVKVHNERGGVLVGAYVTERIMPGAVYVDHGARYDPIVPGELDRGGAINTITPHSIISKNATGMAVSSFLVEVDRVDLDELRRKYPEAFKRAYRQAAGLLRERILVK
jgi:molybdopterin guanine dinucleotide-containing S/N-oxide reductase-like protein